MVINYLGIAAFAILPAFIWLVFFLFEDKHPEPKWMISKTFIAGAVAGAAALVAQIYLIEKYPILDIRDDLKDLNEDAWFQPSIIRGFIIFVFIEEVFKFLAVFLTVSKSRFFDEPIDAMIYMITGAMGLAAFENILYLLENRDILVELNVFRFIGAILLHAVASGFIGYFWAKRKVLVGIAIAVGVHFAFNYIVTFVDKGELYLPFGGEALAPFMLILMSLFLFRDFDIMKRQGNV